MPFLYVVQNIKGRRYIGITDDVDRRVKQHNAGHVRSTKAHAPWELVYTEQYQTKIEARFREKELKTNSWKRADLFRRLLHTKAPSSNG